MPERAHGIAGEPDRLAALSERDRDSVSLFVDEMKADRAQRKASAWRAFADQVKQR